MNQQRETAEAIFWVVVGGIKRILTMVVLLALAVLCVAAAWWARS